MTSTTLLRRDHLAFLSAALTATCVLPYLRDIRRGTTVPQRASWFVFAALSTIAAVAQYGAGSGPGAWLAAGSAMGFTLVFVASLRHGVGGFAPWDRAALLTAAVGVIISLITRSPFVAVIAVVAAEVAAVALTVHKAMLNPQSETATTWVIDCAAGLVAIAAVTDPTATTLLYPIHHTVANAAVVVALAAGNRANSATTAEPPS